MVTVTSRPMAAPKGTRLKIAIASPPMPQSRVGEDGNDIGNEIEADIDGGEDKADRLYDRHVPPGVVVTEGLAHAGTGEEHREAGDPPEHIRGAAHAAARARRDGARERVCADEASAGL